MNTDSILNLVETFFNLPWYAYLIGFIVLGIIFGKRKVWEFEAKLFEEGKSKIKGELEIRKYSKDPEIKAEIDLYMDTPQSGKTFEITIGGQTLYKGTFQGNQWNKMKFTPSLQIKPQNNQQVSVKIDSKSFYGQFFKD